MSEAREGQELSMQWGFLEDGALQVDAHRVTGEKDERIFSARLTFQWLFCKPMKCPQGCVNLWRFLCYLKKYPDLTGLFPVQAVDKPVENVENPCRTDFRHGIIFYLM